MYIQAMIVGVIRTCKIGRKWGWGVFSTPPFIQTFISSYTPILFHSSFIIPYRFLFIPTYLYRFSYYNTPYRIGSPYSYSYRSNHYCFLYYIGSSYSHSLQTHFILSHVQMQYRLTQLKRLFLSEVFLIQNRKKK